MKTIYILLTRTTSVPSRLIHRFTNDPYTHVAISFEDELPVMYSFARKYARLPLPGGLVKEQLDHGFYRSQANAPCRLMKLRVPDAIYARAKNKVADMYDMRGEYSYSVLGLIMCKLDIAMEIPGQYFCSQFVGRILSDSGALDLPKPPPLMHPYDFDGIAGVTPVFTGNVGELSRVLNLYGDCRAPA